MITIIGLDLSLTATGWARLVGDDPPSFGTIETKGLTGWQRLDYIRATVKALTNSGDIVVIEGLSFGSAGGRHDERAGLHWLVRDAMRRHGQTQVLVPPTTLKKFVTGKGNTEKSVMLREVYKRWGVEAANDNEADAIGLAKIGECLAGIRSTTTKAQEEALAKLPKLPKIEVPA